MSVADRARLVHRRAVRPDPRPARPGRAGPARRRLVRPSRRSVVRTAPGSYDEALAVTEEELGPDVVAAAGARSSTSVAGAPERPRGAVHVPRPVRDRLDTVRRHARRQLRNWLAANPDEVVTLFIEDHVDSALIAADVEAAGLLPYVHQPGRRRAVADARRDDRLRAAPRRDGRGGRRRRRRHRGWSTASSSPRTRRTRSRPSSRSAAPPTAARPTPRCSCSTTGSPGFRSLVTSAQAGERQRRAAAPGRAVPGRAGPDPQLRRRQLHHHRRRRSPSSTTLNGVA